MSGGSPPPEEDDAAAAPHDGLSGPCPAERERPSGQRSKQGIRVAPGTEATHPPRRTTISALVEHESGVLAEVSGLVSRRQFNIESLTVGPTTNPETARITLVIDEPEPGVRQVERQLEKLVPVISVRELGSDAVQRELVVLKVHADRPEQVEAITRMYDGTTLDAGPRTITVEVTGDEQTVNDAIDAFRQFDIRELARTGGTALARGDEWTTDAEESRYERLREQSVDPPTGTAADGSTSTARANDQTDETNAAPSNDSAAEAAAAHHTDQ